MVKIDHQNIKKAINILLKKYLGETRTKQFIPGKTLVPYAGAIYDEKELSAMIDVLLKGWFGLGIQGELLEKELAEFLGCKQAYLVNSGSSADLLAIATLMSYQFTEHLNPGDEVITPACTFPTVVSSLVHHRLKPVFVDVDLETLNPNPKDIEKAITKKTKMIFLVHTLGNPNDMDPIVKIAKDHNLLLLEDNCDALGSTYNGKKTGTFGIMATESFYPAHHMTTAGEGGALFINDIRLKRIASSIREWGRSCWCGASGGGPNGVCGVRFNYNIDGIPYDHKYIFSHVGYNIKPVEIQAAMGRAQLKKLPEFIKKRKKNFKLFYEFFNDYQDFFILPKALSKSDPSWFAFPLTIRKNAPFDRFAITQFLENHLIQTRPMFAGNITRQPGYKRINYRKIGDLKNSDLIFSNTFFIGVYPGIGKAQLEYMKNIVKKFLKQY